MHSRASTHTASLPDSLSACASKRLESSSPQPTRRSAVRGLNSRKAAMPCSSLARASHSACKEPRNARAEAPGSTCRATASCRWRMACSICCAASNPPEAARSEADSNWSVTPARALTTSTIGSWRRATIPITRRRAAASSTEVPPNLSTTHPARFPFRFAPPFACDILAFLETAAEIERNKKPTARFASGGGLGFL